MLVLTVVWVDVGVVAVDEQAVGVDGSVDYPIVSVGMNFDTLSIYPGIPPVIDLWVCCTPWTNGQGYHR